MIKSIILHYFFPKRYHIIWEISTHFTSKNDIHIICHAQIWNQNCKIIKILFPFFLCLFIIVLKQLHKLFHRILWLTNKCACSAISICTTWFSTITLAALRYKYHMSKFSGLLIFSGKQISPYAKCTAKSLIQRKVNCILIGVHIFCHHCRIGIIFKINRDRKCLFQETETIVFKFQCVGFYHQFLLLINDSRNRDSNTQKLFFLFCIIHMIQKFRRIICHLTAIWHIRYKFQTDPLWFHNLILQIYQHHSQMICSNHNSHCITIGWIDSNTFSLSSSCGFIFSSFYYDTFFQ